MKAFSIGDTLIIVHLRNSYNRLKISTFSLNPNKKPLYTSFSPWTLPPWVLREELKTPDSIALRFIKDANVPQR